MDTLPTYEETLIARYLSGEASADEIGRLKQWLEADESNLLLFNEYRDSWALLEQARIEAETDTGSAWDHFARTHIHSDKKKLRLPAQSTTGRLTRFAAIFLLLILPAAIYFIFYMSPGQTTLTAENEMIESTLPDGTEVTLNTGSVLHYPEKFRGKLRNVKLEGEAYFDVARNEEKAFVIDAGDLQIKVLGTTFYVNTRHNDHAMEVALLSGSIRLDYRHEELLLEPGQKAIVDHRSGQIIKKEYDDPNLLAWKTRIIRFNNTPLDQVVATLEKVYHKDIVVLNPELLQCRITASFEGESFESVVQVIQSTLNITARPNGTILELSGEACQ